jgi:predicted MPP superfamily phosphohydrolase
MAILGNHDWGRAWSEHAVADEVAAVLRECGVEVLRNEARDCRGLTIAGLDDFWSPGWRPEPILRELPAERPALVLCHNPDAADRRSWGNYRGWILSGHTHGGQVRPPFFRPPLLPVRNRRYTCGEFELAAGRRLYVNRGLGASTRVRFNARPEVTVFRLAAA